MSWRTLLREAVDAKGLAAVAADLGYHSKSVVCEALKGTYRGNLDRLEERVLAAYARPDVVTCPVLGAIPGTACAAHRDLAKRLGVRGGNPQTVRLRKTCLHCSKHSNAVRTEDEHGHP
ncbi:hypothetical protein JCM15519_04080 [Fundidesulfovibrio butyratiphilus]